jgi:zinc D-Ala-D-Ala carboxypeptidase
MSMQVTHFDLAEFCESDTATRCRIDNTLPEALEPQAWATLAMLEGIRAHLSAKAGKDIPVFISSGYRSPALNAAVGGVPSSDHVKACAADIKAPAFGSPLVVARELAAHVDELGIGQLINEFPGSGGWVHVSTRRPDKALNRIITITAKGAAVGVRES